MTIKKESSGNEIDVDLQFKPKVGMQLEISDLAFKFTAKGSETGELYAIEGTVSSLKTTITGQKEDLNDFIVIPSLHIRDVHIDVDNFLSVTKNDKLLHLEHALKEKYITWIKA